MSLFLGLLSEFFHGRNKSDAGAAVRALGGGHLDDAFRCGAAAILFRAVVACAPLARNADFFGHGLVARDFFLDELNHATFAAGVDFFGDGVKMTGFHLFGFSAVTSGVAAASEHRTA